MTYVTPVIQILVDATMDVIQEQITIPAAVIAVVAIPLVLAAAMTAAL